VYLQDRKATNQRSIDLGGTGDIEILFVYALRAVEIFIKRRVSLATDTEYGSRYKIYVLDKDFNPIEEYDIISYRVWSADHSFYLDRWYIYINQDQVLERRFTSGDIWLGVYIEVYRLKTNCRYFIEE